MPWVADERLVPPVALLGYLPNDVSRAAFWPLADFSPEWQAARWAAADGVPLVPIDVPMSWALTGDSRHGLPDDATLDPIGALAAASGEPDAERWWEDVVEHRGDGAPAFAAIAAAMAAVRGGTQSSPSEAVREAHMRTAIRPALAGGATVAVVCGAWHVPALDPASTTATSDRSDPARSVRRSGQPRSKAAITWVPWTDRGCSGAPATPPESPRRAGTATSSITRDRRASSASSSTPPRHSAATDWPRRPIT